LIGGQAPKGASSTGRDDRGVLKRRYKMTNRVDTIIEKNESVLVEFFTGIASCDYYDGMSYQLYLDLDDDTLMIHQEASDQSWLQRDDGSLLQITRVSGYCDIPENERYSEGCDLNDYGYGEWIDMLSDEIAEAIKR
jgi:hypothetical protein